MGHRRQRRSQEVVASRGRQSVWPTGKCRYQPGSGTFPFFLCVIFLTSALAACSFTPGSSDSPSTQARLVVGVPEAGAPGAELGIGQFASLLSFESLTENGSDGRPRPRLAERWQWENNDLRLRVFLRDDVILHNGESLTANVAAGLVDEVVRSNADRYVSFGDVRSVRAEGQLEIVFELARPSALLIADLTVPLSVPGKNEFGSGAYQVVERSDDEVVLERFDRYYLGTPAIERVVAQSFDTLRTTWASLLRGELDMVYDVPADAIEFIRNDEVQVVSVPRWYQYLVAFNSSRGPLRSPTVRRALNLAVNRNALIERVLNGRGTAATGPIWPAHWAYDPSVTTITFDPVSAASLLDEAGFPMPATPAASMTAPPARFRFTCLIPENFTVWEHVGLEVQRELFNVGVDMDFEVVSFREFNARMATGDFDAVLVDMISGPTPARPYIFWRSADRFRGQFNVFGYENSDAERVFDVLRTSTNDAAVRSAMNRLQRIMADDPPALFIAWNERSRAIRRDITIPDHQGHDLMWTLWRWSRNPMLASAAVP